MNNDTTFTQACTAVEAVVPRFTALLRSNPDATTKAIGRWTLPEVACHVSHVMQKDTDALTRRELPFVELSPAAVAVMTDAMLAEDLERDTAALADRIDRLGSVFLQLRTNPPTEPVTWIGGTQLRPATVACHLLEELLVHGHDAATAAGRPWPIDPAHAALAITGGALPIIAASPRSFAKPNGSPDARARVEIRLRGFDRFLLALDDGLRVEVPPYRERADAHLSADATSMLLLMLGRQSHWHALWRGKVFAWGRRPQALLTLLRNISPP